MWGTVQEKINGGSERWCLHDCELLFLFPLTTALSQDENEMGRFLREQGSQDKSKAGKMMIAVGKAQSYSAQQRYTTFNYSVYWKGPK